MRSLTLFLLMISLVTPARGDIHNKAGTTGLTFLTIGVGARVVGMGEAFVAVADDASALYWNPAGLPRLSRAQFHFTHNQWFQDIRHEYAGFTFQLGHNAVGVSLALSTVGQIPRRDEIPTAEPLGSFDAHDVAWAFSYARRVSSVDVGITMKGLYEKISLETATGWAIDVGVLYDLFDELRVGGSLQNLGPMMEFVDERFHLPSLARLGVAFLPSTNSGGSWLMAMDVVKPRGGDVALHSGVEYTYGAHFSLRLGYQIGYDERNVTAGFGFRHGRYGIDYAFVPYGSDLGNTHRGSLLLSL